MEILKLLYNSMSSDQFLKILKNSLLQSTEETVKTWIESRGYNIGAVMNALRLLIVGASRGPHMFDIISWIGKEETLKRIDRGISNIGEKP